MAVPLLAARDDRKDGRAFFCLSRLSRHYLPPVAPSGEKDESEVRSHDCTERVSETAHSEHLRNARCDCREPDSTYDGQAYGGRPPARPCGGQSALRAELRLQPKIGRLALQAAVDLSSASSREQAAVYYTSADPRETDVALH